MPADIGEVLIDEAALAERVGQLAQQISTDYQGCDLVLVAVLKGAVVFLADLMRRLTLPAEVEFVSASSYGAGTTSCGDVRISLPPDLALAGRHVLVVEDIVDTGRTLQALVSCLRAAGAASVRTCCLLDKPSRREVDFRADYVGFEIPDQFVVGYGLDFAGKHRGLPFVAVLRPDA